MQFPRHNTICMEFVQLRVVDLDVDIDPPTPAGVLGDETFPPTRITGHSVNTTPADSYLLQILLECLSAGLTWTSSFFASIRSSLHSHTCRSTWW